MLKSRSLKITVPLMLIMLALLAFKYGYVRVKSDIDSIKEEHSVKIQLLEKYNSIIAERPWLEKKRASLKKERTAYNTKLIKGLTPSLSAAALQEAIKGTIIESGGTISSERMGKTEDMGKFKAINISIDAVLPDTGALSDILYFIETRTPYLIVKELDVRNSQSRRIAKSNLNKIIIKLSVSALTSGK